MVMIKILVRKKELKHMVAMMGGVSVTNAGTAHQTPSSPPSLTSVLLSSSPEQCLNVIMRRRHFKRPDRSKGSRSPWRPVLQSIPEELL
uniref:Uncharacterized protein n=1 Tax=Nelumbo nucifera TaxID=4432 RepID=A0A822Z9J3_NELNU|nr:TPA_asm: hypothetical protein HUJ06_016045 [Nelumbo nucifera]